MVILLARVMAVLKVYPKDVDIDLDKVVSTIINSLPVKYSLVKSEKEYIAFGLYLLRIYVIMPEEMEGGTEELEGLIRSIDGVENVETEMVTRISD